jgi:hypothetical protein
MDYHNLCAVAVERNVSLLFSGEQEVGHYDILQPIEK